MNVAVSFSINLNVAVSFSINQNFIAVDWKLHSLLKILTFFIFYRKIILLFH